MGRCLIIFVHYISYLVIYCSLHYIHPCPCNTRVLPITVSLNVYIYTSVPSLISLHILSYYSYSNIRLILCAILLLLPLEFYFTLFFNTIYLFSHLFTSLDRYRLRFYSKPMVLNMQIFLYCFFFRF